MIYVPNSNVYDECYVINNNNTLRAYSRQPQYNATISYRDYYFNSSYIYTDGSQTFGNYTTLPACLSSNEITHNVFYRNDIDKILITFIIILLICFYFPYKILSRMFGRWLKV